MAIAKRSTAIVNLMSQSAFRGFVKGTEQQRAELLRERDIALHFGDLNMALRCARDLRQLHKDHLQSLFKVDLFKGPDDSAHETLTPATIRKDLLNHMEQEKSPHKSCQTV